jgi:hypothetical protein
MQSFPDILSSVPLRSWVALIISVLGIAAICLRVLETDGVRAKRAERNKKKELRLLAERISSYGYPTGDVIVSELDLAEQLRKRPDAVATALNLLLNEQKVQRATLSGYWKLNGDPQVSLLTDPIPLLRVPVVATLADRLRLRFTADRARAHPLACPESTAPGVGRGRNTACVHPLCVVAGRTAVSLTPGGIPNWVSAEHGRSRSSAHTAKCSTMLLLE